MAANTTPIYTKRGDSSADGATAMPGTLLAAAADYTGVSPNHILVHTAGADGSYVRALLLKALGTNVATVARLYVNNGGPPATAANNLFISEITLPATTASAVASTPDVVLPIDRQIDPTFKLYVGIATAVAAGWRPSVVAGRYS